jgi:hypothetical protein
VSHTVRGSAVPTVEVRSLHKLRLESLKLIIIYFILPSRSLTTKPGHEPRVSGGTAGDAVECP